MNYVKNIITNNNDDKDLLLTNIKPQLYGQLPPISKTSQITQTRHVVHCWGSKDELISDVLPGIFSHERAGVGRPARTWSKGWYIYIYIYSKSKVSDLNRG